VSGIVDYASLQAAVIEYLARDDDTTLIARVPTFIQLFEAKMNRDLSCRQMEVRAKTLTDPTSTEPEFIALPADYQNMRRIRVTSIPGRPLITFMSTVQMQEFREKTGDVSDTPLYFTIFGNEIELAPTPDNVYTIEMIYRQSVPSLSDTNTSNWLLQEAPDLYLYGTLMETAPAIKEDNRITTWAQLMVNARDSLNDSSANAEFNAGPLQVRVSGLTP
jgi:hypothetical protein